MTFFILLTIPKRYKYLMIKYRGIKISKIRKDKPITLKILESPVSQEKLPVELS